MNVFSAKCASCGKCAENCPMNGIIMKDGKPVWTGACTHCMACLCGCPAEAIEYGRRSVGKVRYQCPEYKAKEKTAESASEEKTVQPMNGDTKIMMKYTQQFEIPAESFDENANLVPSQVLSVFQTLADRHAAILGVDFDKMYSRGFLWVITQIKYQVCGELKPGETVTGVTWPLPPSRLAYDREYLICGEDGNTIIKGTSNWVLIDVKERRIASAENVYPEGEHCTDKNFSEKLRRLRDFEATGEPCRICPDESHIDANGHVNNTKYADFVRTALGGFSREIDVFQIDYINEVMCGQPLDICCTATENGAAAKGISEEGKRMFACSVTYK